MRLKLHTSIVLATVIGLLIPAGISGLLTLEQREYSLKHQLISDHQHMVDILALGMQEPLWNLNPESGRPLLQSLMSDRRVTSLIVRDQRFGTFLSEEHPERRHSHQYVIDRTILHDGSTIGQVSVEIDSSQLDELIAHDRFGFEITVLGQLLFSLLLIVMLLRLRLLKPIKRLILESQRLARKELSEPFLWHGNDELASLGHRLESTRQALHDLFDQLEAKNRELECDIEQRRKVENELQRHCEHLEDLVREHTAELMVAKDRAEVANRAKTAFLSSMSHELRTPLNAVLGYAQVLKRDGGLSGSQLANIDAIYQSGEHLLALITDLLDLAKIEAGKFDVDPVPTNLASSLRIILDIIRVRAEQKGVSFVIKIDDPLPETVIIDDKRLRQVLLNLLGNAIKFTDHGEVSLHVRATPRNDSEMLLHFEVRDTGVGLEQDQVHRIFEPFEQVGDIRRRYGGTGLGLTISRQLVRLMGGEIRVDSEPGSGSTFCFELLVEVAKTSRSTGIADVLPASDDKSIMQLPALAVPQQEQMERLHDLALSGNMRGIREYAVWLASVDENYRPFAEHLHKLAMQYQSKALLHYVEEFMRALHDTGSAP